MSELTSKGDCPLQVKWSRRDEYQENCTLDRHIFKVSRMWVQLEIVSPFDVVTPLPPMDASTSSSRLAVKTGPVGLLRIQTSFSITQLWMIGEPSPWWTSLHRVIYSSPFIHHLSLVNAPACPQHKVLKIKLPLDWISSSYGQASSFCGDRASI